MSQVTIVLPTLVTIGTRPLPWKWNSLKEIASMAGCTSLEAWRRHFSRGSFVFLGYLNTMDGFGLRDTTADGVKWPHRTIYSMTEGEADIAYVPSRELQRLLAEKATDRILASKPFQVDGFSGWRCNIFNLTQMVTWWMAATYQGYAESLPVISAEEEARFRAGIAPDGTSLPSLGSVLTLNTKRYHHYWSSPLPQ